MKLSLEKIHKSLKQHTIDTEGNIYINDIKQPFNRTFTYANKTRRLESIMLSVFSENPFNFQTIIFKDGNTDNFKLENLSYSSVNQEGYNFQQNIDKLGVKFCKQCESFKSYSEYYKSKKGNFQARCKKCEKENRDLKKEEYNKKRQERRKTSPEKSLYSKMRYKKWKEEQPEEYIKFIEKNRQYRIDNWHINILSRLKARALKEGIPFNLTKEDLFIPDLCPILNIPIFLYVRGGNCVSWDRIIPSEGYVKGNVRAISKKANVMKNNANLEEMEIFVKNIIPYMKKKA